MSNIIEYFISNELNQSLSIAIEDWELTKSDIIEGSDGCKFDDGLESFAKNLKDSVIQSIYNKLNKHIPLNLTILYIELNQQGIEVCVIVDDTSQRYYYYTFNNFKED